MGPTRQAGRAGWRTLLAALAMLGGLAWGGAALADDDLVAPSDEATIALGKERYSAKCGGFCHGAGGKGGRAPCIVCGRFKRGGSNAEIAKNITEGVKGTPMGAFGEVYSREEIIAIVSYLRDEERKKKEAEGN